MENTLKSVTKVSWENCCMDASGIISLKRVNPYPVGLYLWEFFWGSTGTSHHPAVGLKIVVGQNPSCGNELLGKSDQFLIIMAKLEYEFEDFDGHLRTILANRFHSGSCPILNRTFDPYCSVLPTLR